MKALVWPQISEGRKPHVPVTRLSAPDPGLRGSEIYSSLVEADDFTAEWNRHFGESFRDSEMESPFWFHSAVHRHGDSTPLSGVESFGERVYGRMNTSLICSLCFL